MKSRTTAQLNVKKFSAQTAHYLDTCGRNGVILNPKKFKFAQETVDFCGYEIGLDYVRPSKKFFTAETVAVLNLKDFRNRKKENRKGRIRLIDRDVEQSVPFVHLCSTGQRIVRTKM